MGNKPRATHGFESLMLGLVLAVALLVGGALLNDHSRAAPGVEIGADPGLKIESLEQGGALWDLAREYAPTQDPRRWIERVKELNGWSEVPNLQPHEGFIIPDWRKWPMNIRTIEHEDGSVEVRPIDPYPGDGIGQGGGAER